jgi:hypothetical protein
VRYPVCARLGGPDVPISWTDAILLMVKVMRQFTCAQRNHGSSPKISV